MGYDAERSINKLSLLADAAKYDASCSTSGSQRPATPGGTGNTARAGICHSWANDGRCVSLLKVLLTNSCIYDCAYCINRHSNDIPRTGFSCGELVGLVMDFYRRNYIEGLFLSSGVAGSPDRTMERMLAVVKTLRIRERFNGYIHMKTIPGSSKELVVEAGRYADRLSVNIELPSLESLKVLAPDKTKEQIFGSMSVIRSERMEYSALAAPDNYGSGRNFPVRSFSGMPARTVQIPQFVPAGQTTQMLVGASGESDRQILTLMQRLYRRFDLKRVYYSAYIPLNDDPRLPKGPVPLRREHRLYQADWLFRFYSFDAEEILDESSPFLNDALDPKAAWAIRHPEYFPVEVMRAPLEQLLRVPGIGPVSARRILRVRRGTCLRVDNLSSLGVVMKRARFFVTASGTHLTMPDSKWELLASSLSDGGGPREKAGQPEFDFTPPDPAVSYIQPRLSQPSRPLAIAHNSSGDGASP